MNAGNDMRIEDFQAHIRRGIPAELPPPPPADPGVSRAPVRPLNLTDDQKRLAMHNALRYFPAHMHAALAPEFADELSRWGRIYMHRFRPAYAMRARPLDQYPAQCRQAAAIMLMIQNNLDPAVAQHPYELITYGGNGTVFQNWAYGQMTAGSYMYIGPQGIVHGTTITVLGAGRLLPGAEGSDDPLAGKLYVSSGLGGMSGAQGKAAVIAGCVGVLAEINPDAVRKRHEQGWVDEVFTDLPALLERIRTAKSGREAVALAYQGNVVDLWEALAGSDIAVELGSDQTSLHIPYTGGYYPAGMSYHESNAMMAADPDGFKAQVQASLLRHLAAVEKCVAKGMKFWDYGNAFLLECARAGADIRRPDGGFTYPSYVEDIMGPMCFDYGFGPFRWVCTSGDPADLAVSDRIAGDVIEILAATAPDETRQQYLDNLRWIRQAGDNRMVVGSQARILYSDAEGRRAIAAAFNRAIRRGQISAPIVLGRDHHDVSGTDSPFRETSNIRDGSMYCADMAVQNVIGDGFRGATWISLHNGGGVGWGEVINGGFGMVLDGSEDADRRLHLMLHWDVNNGIARRAWARNGGAEFAIRRAMQAEPGLTVTMPEHADDALVDGAVRRAFGQD